MIIDEIKLVTPDGKTEYRGYLYKISCGCGKTLIVDKWLCATTVKDYLEKLVRFHSKGRKAYLRSCKGREKEEHLLNDFQSMLDALDKAITPIRHETIASSEQERG